MKRASEDPERGNWGYLREQLFRGYRRPGGSDAQHWRPRDVTPAGLDRLVQTAVAIARLEMPEDFSGTRLDPMQMNRLGQDVCRLFDLLDQSLSPKPLALPALTKFAEVAPQIVEPFLAKVLVRCACQRLLDEVSVRLSLSRFVKMLAAERRSPFDERILSMSDDDFRTARGSESWSCLTWCLWNAMGARNRGAHNAPLLQSDEALPLLWSTAITLLSVSEQAIDLFDVAGGRLPARFRAIRRLGVGGMGEVFLAEDEVTGSSRAIKVVRVADRHSSEAGRALLREARALNTLESRRVVRFYDAIPLEHGIALVMSYVEGESLQSELDATGALPVREAVNTTIEVLSALEDIHAAGFVHRDVKPSNFIRTSTGVVAIDFGLARPIGEELTKSSRAGSERFVAPEQLEGKADHRSDLYAAGRLLFTLLAGHPPAHDGDSLTRASAAVSPGLCEVYRKATEREPSDRYQTADEMRSALEAAMQLGEPPRELSSPTRVSDLREELAPGRRWGEYLVETMISHSERRWTLVRARARTPFAARARQIWVHHEPTEAGRLALLESAVALLELSSPSIQSVEEVLEEPEIALVLQEVAPTSLASTLKRCASAGRRLSVATSLGLAREVARSLSVLHGHLAAALESGRIHAQPSAGGIPMHLPSLRIWPHAVRVSSRAAVKLSVFEMFRDVAGDSSAVPVHLLRYRAPEVLKQLPLTTSQDIERSLVYTVALMLWECIVGSQAFQARTQDDLLREVVDDKVVSPTAKGIPISRELEDLLMRALSTEPGGRPSTLSDFADAIGSIPLSPAECSRELVELVTNVPGPVAREP